MRDRTKRDGRFWKLGALVTALSLLVAACGGGGDAEGEPTEAAEDGAGEATEETTDEKTPLSMRVAAVLPGSTTDADYNTLGFLALEAAGELGAETAFSESVAVPDVERVMREYVADGFDVIWSHGSQFFEQTNTLAQEFPDVTFIGEFDAEPESTPDNLWVIDRNFHIGFYPIGALAAKRTESGKIGYVGGLSLPFSYAEVHAIQQAISDLGADVEFRPVWTGDFNDPTKARQVADQLMADGVDVLIGSLNLGMVGLFEAAKQKGEGVWVTSKYTDKSQFAPDNYLTSVLYDFEGPLVEILSKIASGERSGYYPLGFETGVGLQMPIQNSSEDLSSEIEEVVSQVETGAIEVEKDTTPVE